MTRSHRPGPGSAGRERRVTQFLMTAALSLSLSLASEARPGRSVLLTVLGPRPPPAQASSAGPAEAGAIVAPPPSQRSHTNVKIVIKIFPLAQNLV